MAKHHVTISEALRQIILESGLTEIEIERATGVSNANLNRFMRGKRGLSLATVDKLAEHFGLELVKRKGGRHE